MGSSLRKETVIFKFMTIKTPSTAHGYVNKFNSHFSSNFAECEKEKHVYNLKMKTAT